MIFRPPDKAAFVLFIALLIAAVAGSGLLLRKQSAPRRAAMTPDAVMRNPIVPGAAVGPIRLGMTEDEVTAALGKPKLVMGGRNWSYDSPDMAVMFAKDSPTVVAIFGGGRPRTNLPFRSVEGIGLGSTPAEIEAAWGKPDKRSETSMVYLSRGIELMFGNGRLEWFCVRKFGTTRPATIPSAE